MYSKGNVTYADAYKYLRKRDARVIALQTAEDAAGYVEEEMARPLEVSVENGAVKFGGWFVVRPPTLGHGDVKRAVIKMRYSYDDQMAIILNRDSSEDAAALYDRMQEWRAFAGEIARLVDAAGAPQAAMVAPGAPIV